MAQLLINCLIISLLPDEEGPEVGWADAEDELVCWEIVVSTGQGDIDELLLVTKIFCQLKERFVVIVPFEK